MKTCYVCQLDKVEKDFAKRNNGSYRNHCKKCDNERRRLTYWKNIDKERARNRLKSKLHYPKNKQYILEWARKNRDKRRLSEQKYYSNPNNCDKRRMRIRLYLRNKRKNCLVFRLRNTISNHIRHCLKNNHIMKNFSSWSKLPYTPQQLKEHLESLWEPWMSWENYGPINVNKRTWQIDHIVPQSKLPYDSLDHPNFIKCWLLNNLRPLESTINNKRGNRS